MHVSCEVLRRKTVTSADIVSLLGSPLESSQQGRESSSLARQNREPGVTSATPAAGFMHDDLAQTSRISRLKIFPDGLGEMNLRTSALGTAPVHYSMSSGVNYNPTNPSRPSRGLGTSSASTFVLSRCTLFFEHSCTSSYADSVTATMGTACITSFRIRSPHLWERDAILALVTPHRDDNV